MNEPATIHSRRSTHLVEKGFQLRFILKFCLLVLGGTFISTLLVLVFTRGSLTSSFEDSRLVIKTTASAILPALAYTNLITLGLITIATVLVTLFVSHKIAGPIYRIEKELGEIAKGDLTKTIFLRKKDQLTTLATNINEMVTNFHMEISEIKGDVQQIKHLAEQTGASEPVLEQLNNLEIKLERYFKL